MAKIRDDIFFVTYGWMMNRLGLKGVALQIFSIIYGFDRNGTDGFRGSLQYLVSCTNCSKNTVIKALKELVQKGYIKKTENIVNNVRFCIYQVNAPYVQKLKQGSVETELEGCSKITRSPGPETELNNIDLNNNFLINNEIVQNVVDLYNTTCTSFPKAQSLTKDRINAIDICLQKFSVDNCLIVFQKAEASSFLKNHDGGWTVDFDWLMKTENFVKTLEGKYDDKKSCPQDHKLGVLELRAIHNMNVQ